MILEKNKVQYFKSVRVSKSIMAAQNGKKKKKKKKKKKLAEVF